MAKKGKPARGQLEERVKELDNKWKRALADYLNLEKRVEKEKSVLTGLATARILDKLLPVLDELEICQEHLGNEGLALVISRFLGVLESEGVEEISVQGKEFDPQAMDAVEVVSGSANKVVEVVLKGYAINGKVLRPVKVKVGKGKNKNSV